MIQAQIDIKPESKDIICNLAKKYGIKIVMVFGSVAKGKAREGSDIDLAILADKKFYEKYFSDFVYDLTEVENMEKKEIEVVPIGADNPLLLYNIFNDGVPIYIENEEEYQRLRGWARFIYEDNMRFFFGREELLRKKMEKLKFKIQEVQPPIGG